MSEDDMCFPGACKGCNWDWNHSRWSGRLDQDLLWEVLLAAAGQAGPSLTDPGPHDPLSLIAGGHVALKFCFVRSWGNERALWVWGRWPLSHRVPDAEPLLTISRRHGMDFTVIDGNVMSTSVSHRNLLWWFTGPFDWHRICTTLLCKQC